MSAAHPGRKELHRLRMETKAERRANEPRYGRFLSGPAHEQGCEAFRQRFQNRIARALGSELPVEPPRRTAPSAGARHAPLPGRPSRRAGREVGHRLVRSGLRP